jgi:hypothetical protein
VVNQEFRDEFQIQGVQARRDRMQGALKVTTPTDREIVMTRLFNAPRQAVWDAMTKPELLRQWLFSPPGWELATVEEDLRVGGGGGFKWEWQAGGQTVMCLTGAYREVQPPGPSGAGGRIVRTESGCVPGGGELLATLELAEHRGDAGGAGGAGVTVLTMTLVYPTKKDRDTMIEVGMAQGMEAGYERLEGMLGT